MIESELLKEKYLVQQKLSKESASVKEYLKRSHLAAIEIAESRGFFLRYVEMPNNRLNSGWKKLALFPAG